MLTGTAFDFIRMDLPCPECGKSNKEPIKELVVKDAIACSYCGEAIDLSTENTRATITEFAEEAKKIKRVP